jgi:hypothetical protein
LCFLDLIRFESIETLSQGVWIDQKKVCVELDDKGYERRVGEDEGEDGGEDEGEVEVE